MLFFHSHFYFVLKLFIANKIKFHKNEGLDFFSKPTAYSLFENQMFCLFHLGAVFLFVFGYYILRRFAKKQPQENEMHNEIDFK